MNQVPHIYGTIVQSLGCVWLFATPWTAAHQTPLSFTISWGLLKLMSIDSVMLFKHLTLFCPFSCPQSFSATGSFPMSWLFALSGQNIGASASVFPMHIQGWFPLGLTGFISLLSKGLSSLLQHNWKASILQHSAIFIAQLSHPCTTTGKTIALTRRTFVGKVISLLFNILLIIVCCKF